MHHWTKAEDDSPYVFAKCNRSVDVRAVAVALTLLFDWSDAHSQAIELSKEEYDRHVQHDAWTYEETQLLLQLCVRFDLRFIVIQDRFKTAHAELTAANPGTAYKQVCNVIWCSFVCLLFSQFDAVVLACLLLYACFCFE